jgi:hypothetical protein
MRHILTSFALLALAGPALAQINEGFEAYPDGPLSGQGGWEIWYSGGADGAVVSGGAHSGNKSMQMVPGTDAVQRFTINGGQWDCSVWTFLPSGSLDAYFIMMNQYGDATTDNWSVQIRLNGDPANPVVESQFDFATVPAVLDTWVELRLEIDLDADIVNTFYNGNPLGVNLSWINNVSGAGLPQIRCIDLYSQTNDGFRWDDLVVEEAGAPCPGDLNGDGIVDLSDLATLLAHFGAPGGAADGDINGDGLVDLSDLALLLANFGVTEGAGFDDGDLDGDGDVELQDLAILLARFGGECT